MKKCSNCNKIKPFEGFYYHPKTKDGFGSRCKECSKKINNARLLNISYKDYIDNKEKFNIFEINRGKIKREEAKKAHWRKIEAKYYS